MARQLVDTETGETVTVASEPPDLVAAAQSGNRLTALQDLRQVLARTIVECEYPRDVAALSRQLTDVLAQIDEIQAGKQEQKGSPLDELQNRRAAREPGGSRRKGA